MVSNIFYVHPYLGKWSNLTNIFRLGWNHQLDLCAFLNRQSFSIMNLNHEKRVCDEYPFRGKISTSFFRGYSRDKDDGLINLFWWCNSGVATSKQAQSSKLNLSPLQYFLTRLARKKHHVQKQKRKKLLLKSPGSIPTWNSKHPVVYSCFNCMIPNHYIKNGCFTISIHLKNGCLGCHSQPC